MNSVDSAFKWSTCGRQKNTDMGETIKMEKRKKNQWKFIIINHRGCDVVFILSRAHIHNRFDSKWIGLELDKLVYNLSSNLTTSLQCNSKWMQFIRIQVRFRRSFMLAAKFNVPSNVCVCAVNHLLQAKQSELVQILTFRFHFYIPFADSILTYDYFFSSFFHSFIRLIARRTLPFHFSIVNV